MGLLDLFRKKQPVKETVSASTQGEEARIISRLEELGYFKYADEMDLPAIKEDLADSLLRLNYLSSLFFDKKPFNSKDYRHYVLDGEELFEEGGFTDKLKDMKILFEKIDFKLAISNHSEIWEKETGLNHSITLNGKDYTIFKDFTGYGWGEAAQRFAEIVNDQLEIQGKDERVYLSNGGNDGNAVFLTEAQFELLDAVLKKEKDKPLKTGDWCRVMKVDMNKYTGS